LILLVTLLMVSTAMAGDIEEPEWELMETLGKVEIRHYASSIQATTVIDSSAHTTAGFRRLAGYIFGGNERSQSIAMTAPVQETLAGGKPVMAFTMPSEYALDELPMPDDERIEIVTVPARNRDSAGQDGGGGAFFRLGDRPESSPNAAEAARHAGAARYSQRGRARAEPVQSALDGALPAAQ
jgi:hypothetical protein